MPQYIIKKLKRKKLDGTFEEVPIGTSANHVEVPSINKKLSEVITDLYTKIEEGGSGKYGGEAPSNLNSASQVCVYKLNGIYTNAPIATNLTGILTVTTSDTKDWTTTGENTNWIWQEIKTTDGNIYRRNAMNTANSWTSWTKVNNLSEADVIDIAYPVGSLYIALNSTNPETLFANTTWDMVGIDRVLIGAGNKYSVGVNTGNSSITIGVTNLPSHSHSIPSLSGYTSTDGNHNHRGRYSQYGTSSGGLLVLRRISNDDGYKGEDQVTYDSGNHSHTVTTYANTSGTTGSGTAIDITPLSLPVYFWKRLT